MECCIAKSELCRLPGMATGSALVTDVVIARALHVLAVVIWIGGVSMVTTVALPAVRRVTWERTACGHSGRSSAASSGRRGPPSSSSG